MSEIRPTRDRTTGGRIIPAGKGFVRKLWFCILDYTGSATRMREQAGMSQKQLAALLKTSQQQISRIESPAYEGHSLSMLRRVAAELDALLPAILGRAFKGAL